MKKYINGKYIELTPEEITAMQAEQAKAEAYERTRPPTTEERLAAMESAMLALMGGGSDV